MTDHAYKRPAMLNLTLAWSDSPGEQNLLNGGFSSVMTVYDKLLKLQESRVPFKVVTGKRTYQNVLILSLITRTTKQTENALFVTFRCKDILRVSVQETTVTTDQSKQSNPASTTPKIDTGTQQPQTAPSPPDFGSYPRAP